MRIVAFEGVQPLDVVGPHEVFAGVNALLDRRRRRTEVNGPAIRPTSPAGYRVEIVAEQVGPVRGESGLGLCADRSWNALATVQAGSDQPAPCDTLVVPGGRGVHRAAEDRELVSWVRDASLGARRTAAVCTGAFLLAAAGRLGGGPVTTHWARAARLAREFPDLEVDPEPIYRRDGDVWTSAGVTAGIDLALALVEDDHGADVAQEVARWLVMFVRRPGGQSQFAPAVWSEPATLEPIRSAQLEIEANPGGPHSVPRLAARVGMSERNFARVFAREVGVPPGRYVEQVRVDAARRALEVSPDGVESVARACGFGTSETMRRAFIRQVGVPPAAYRERFAR